MNTCNCEHWQTCEVCRPEPAPSALDVQVQGDHYKKHAIQPVEFIHANNIPYLEGCAIKYLCRHKAKGGVVDLLKAKHYIDLIISLEYKNQQP